MTPHINGTPLFRDAVGHSGFRYSRSAQEVDGPHNLLVVPTTTFPNIAIVAEQACTEWTRDRERCLIQHRTQDLTLDDGLT